MKKNLKILLFSCLFALALWLYINLSLSYSMDLLIPLDIQSTKSQALSEEIPSAIDVTVKGKGWDLLNIMISKDLRYSIDISKMKKDSRIITEQFVNERLNLQTNVSVMKITPDTININFDKVSEKFVPVKNNIIVNLKDGYSIVGEPILTPDSLRIHGSSALINKIRFIPTETKIFNNINSNLSGVVNIKDTLGNITKVEPKQINYTYNIQLSAEKSFEEVEVQVTNVPEDKEVLLIPPKVNLYLRGGVDQLSQITLSDLNVNVEFAEIESDTLGYIIPEVDIPNATSLLKVEPQKLQYIIKKKL
ncbi:MAG: CdaR family protein [Ignavibacteria bacterium]